MKPAASLREILKDVAVRLDGVSDSPRLDAEMLLALAIDVPRSYFYSHPDDVPDEAALDRLERNVARRLRGEPMAYITGHKEFWSLDLMVSPATLVPRPETERLVELALAAIPRDAPCSILDLGTGSGAIAIALAKERPLADVVATDNSAEALAVAAQNVRQHELANVRCIEGDWTRPVQGLCFDLVVANPPYVETGSEDLGRLAAEPQMALLAGDDGLDAIRILARDCGAIVRDRGYLMLEHGSAQQDGVRAVLEATGWVDIECHRDLAGLPRVSTARRIAPTSG